MNNKRETLKKVAGVSAVVALAPTSWTKPIVSSVILPVHAQTSTDTEAPIGADATFNGGFDEVINGSLTATDNVDPSPTTEIVIQPSQGAVVLTGNDFRYEVTDGSAFVGNDSFTYRVIDSAGNQSIEYTITLNDLADG